MHNILRLIVVILGFAFTTVAQGIFVFAQLPPLEEMSDKERAEATLQLAKEKVAEFDIRLDDDSKTKLTLEPHSILRWSNPVSSALFGEVFLWTAEGRPQAIASFHKFFQPNLRHMSGEFHSLALGKLVGSQGARRVWAPLEHGVTFTVLPGAPPVAGNAKRRLSQMRGIARGFTAETSQRNQVEKREKLRLLPKPIYRYGANDSLLLDGAMFTFVQGTNPEVLLLLEARRSGDQHVWQYALARFNSVALRVSHDGRAIWSVPQAAPPWDNVHDPQKAYFVMTLDRGE